MLPKPRAIVLDVLGTLVSMEGCRAKLVQRGIPADAAEVWFARTHRDGLCAAVAGHYVSMRETAAYNVQLLAGETGLPLADDVAAEVLDGFTEESAVYPDVAPALRKLHEQGMAIATISNGSVSITQKILKAAGIEKLTDPELTMQASDARAWKPSREAYGHAITILTERRGITQDDIVFVAAHPWDVQGATQAGLRSVLVSRKPEPYPPYYAEPASVITSFEKLPGVLGAEGKET